eukprot:GHUV01037988.1.p2 GENE.GHUV01037988.1~~GHUV01037988.1.p2  ORF type:complete len:191 (+),score=11.20 GHUV01037988.1:443-1015(+)
MFRWAKEFNRCSSIWRGHGWSSYSGGLRAARLHCNCSCCLQWLEDPDCKACLLSTRQNACPANVEQMQRRSSYLLAIINGSIMSPSAGLLAATHRHQPTCNRLHTVLQAGSISMFCRACHYSPLCYVCSISTSPLLPQGIIGAVLGLGTLNRVLYRLALVPLKDYVFFLAQAQNIGYILIYYTLLTIRFR